MKKFLIFIIVSLVFILYYGGSVAQGVDLWREHEPWHANWIGSANPNDNGLGYGVYYLRKKVTLADKPKSFIVHLSADNHYKLFVNGNLVSLGPAHGTLHNWKYETVDIAPYLQKGNNLLAAMVWNEGAYRPEAQLSFRTAFIVQGNTAAEELVNTNDSWKCIQDPAFTPILGYYAAVAGQMVDMHKTIHHWMERGYDDSEWPRAKSLFPGQPKGLSDGFGYILVPSTLPARSMIHQPIEIVRRSKGIPPVRSLHFPLTIPANTDMVLLLDQQQETNAYPSIIFSGGENANIGLSYSEALYEKGSNFKVKGNRNQVAGMEFRGLTDSMISDGTPKQCFTPFYFRTYRYMRLHVTTKDQPLVVDSLYGTFTAYPFSAEASFHSDDPQIKKILDIGWHTARLNAYDMYFTGQYYERLQYIGDARIQALISYYYSHDDRLTRNAISQIDESRLADGVTLSRSPSRGTQIIPPFSLIYIGMLHDFWMYRDDPEFVKSKLPGVRSILNFFTKYQSEDGSLEHPPFWNFVDWAKGRGWGFGTPPQSEDGGSAILDLQLLLAFQQAAGLESKIGLAYFAGLYQAKAEQLASTIQHKYWNTRRLLYADTKEQATFSQHANALAMLAGLVPFEKRRRFAERVASDSSLTKCSLYFAYYFNRALVKAGLGNEYMNWLKPWEASIDMGLTTWAEEPDLKTTRSDCHAWSSSPNIEFFRTVLGIDSDAPGFARVKIEPFLGKLTSVWGEIPHPKGKIKVSYQKKKDHWDIQIELPNATEGIFKWKGRSYTIRAGVNSFRL